MKSDSEISPCIKVCAIKDGMCKGCKRTLDEIRVWRNLSDAERLDIMEELKTR